MSVTKHQCLGFESQLRYEFCVINGFENTHWMYFVLIQMRTSVPCEIVLNCLHVTQFSVIKNTFIFIKDAYRAVINVFFFLCEYKDRKRL